MQRQQGTARLPYNARLDRGSHFDMSIDKMMKRGSRKAIWTSEGLPKEAAQMPNQTLTVEEQTSTSGPVHKDEAYSGS